MRKYIRFRDEGFVIGGYPWLQEQVVTPKPSIFLKLWVAVLCMSKLGLVVQVGRVAVKNPVPLGFEDSGFRV